MTLATKVTDLMHLLGSGALLSEHWYSCRTCLSATARSRNQEKANTCIKTPCRTT
jgi:hypothetical protein